MFVILNRNFSSGWLIKRNFTAGVSNARRFPIAPICGPATRLSCHTVKQDGMFSVISILLHLDEPVKVNDVHRVPVACSAVGRIDQQVLPIDTGLGSESKSVNEDRTVLSGTRGRVLTRPRLPGFRDLRSAKGMQTLAIGLQSAPTYRLSHTHTAFSPSPTPSAHDLRNKKRSTHPDQRPWISRAKRVATRLQDLCSRL
jgi:hypothetical protein